ncbi:MULTISPECIES: hypothetical protein [unclassified Vibrio]|uniref:hypothetical protein n=1 Tax=unclassified Vibrio TaxID=2614977 RepID=UPI00148333EC|nr:MULTISPECIES: hypothetical protein [unclassified Vibrio]MDQ2190597.1 hypothetical protein [Vibrio sp. A14(2019)]MDQ2196805.1 hypothetical protein [Vibrio sp. 2017_1457_11]NNN75352.1 hypothetical protein [Vibrio sp. B7]NNN92073.1 hypothetical protein [Vibrio sp. B8-1]NNO07373.1 hypothetical protein [Vibrio sp. B4-12]
MIEFLDRPVAFHRSFVRLGIGVTGALLLSQSLYWSKRTNNTDGWFYKSAEEWKDETGMTRTELETARKKLRNLGILEEKKVGVPCRLHYRINAANLIACLQQTSLQDSCKQACGNPASMAAENLQANTENTQRLPETTSEKSDAPKRKTALSFILERDWPSELNQTAWTAWLEYRKKVLKKPYKSQRSEQAAITKLLNLSKGVAEAQKIIVDQSIDNDWSGLFELKEGVWGAARAGMSNTSTTAQVGESYREGMDISKYQLPESRG